MVDLSGVQHAMGLVGNPNDFIQDHRTCKIIRVVVHTKGLLMNSSKSANHVSLFLLFGGSSAQSVRVNMTIQSKSTRGMLEWTKYGYVLSNSTIVYRDYPLKKIKTVGELYVFMQQRGLHMYQYPGSGLGCRYWTYQAFLSLQNAHLISSSMPNDLWAFLSFQYTRDQPSVAMVPDHGTFLSYDQWQAWWAHGDEDGE